VTPFGEPQSGQLCAFRSNRVVLPDAVVPATVVAQGGRIIEVRQGAPGGPPPPAPAAATCTELADLVLGPGLVDSHVHINEPGRTDWEGFASATRAAAAGGVTTIVDMPLNSVPPTTSVTALRTKQAAASGQLTVDVAFWAGITSQDVSAVGPLVEAGVSGFKVFMADSGVPEFPAVDTDGLLAALGEAGRYAVPVVVHAEAPAVLAAAPGVTGRRHDSWLASRPPEAEIAAIELVVEIAARTGSRAHILHLSTAAALPVLAKARSQGVGISVETCPHYLSLAADDLPAQQSVAKCAPPIRSAANQRELWDGVRAGLLDAIVSDHSPAPAALKQPSSGRFADAWGGIAGLQTQLPVVWTAAARHGVGLVQLAELQAAAPARLAGLATKGRIAVGYDADLVAWDPAATFELDAGRLLHRHKVSPWAGRQLSGVVAATWLRGRAVFTAEGGCTAGHGRLLTRSSC
jgi:allantoinase